MSEQPNTPIDRRDFGRLAFGALAAAAAANLSRTTAAAAKPPASNSAFSPRRNHPTNSCSLKQLGAQPSAWGHYPDLRTAEGFMEIKKRYGDAGITVWNIGNVSVHNMPEVTLNLPGRDQKIEEYKQYLRNLKQAGIRYSTYAHMGNGIWTSGRTACAAPQLASSISTVRTPAATGMARSTPGRSRTAASSTPDEIWENYTYFIKQVAPVAEETGVRIGIHPDDPPVPVLAGVPRCVFSNFAGYKRAMEIADSPNVGICLRCGTWLAAEEADWQRSRRDDPPFWRQEDLEDPLPQHRSPLPHFVETFMDNGYYDMWKIMKALRDVNFDGIVILDHSPAMVGGNYSQTAYGYAYMKAAGARANAEAR